MKTTSLFLALTAVALPHIGAAQTRTPVPDREAPSKTVIRGWYSSQDADRPYIGVTTGSSGKRDTLGLLVTDVFPAGPAGKAGIEDGDRIQAVNGVSLRLAAADAGEPDMEGIALRRLIRELAKGKIGDAIELRVYRDGQSRSVRVTTVSAVDLRPSRTSVERVRDSWNERPTLGIGLGGSGSRRDTAGVLVASVTDDGPADKARMEEGDRIAAINGVDLRVAMEDAGDFAASGSRMRRLTREMEKIKAGDDVELRVTRSGQTRTVRVKTVAMKDLPRQEGSGFFFDGNGAFMLNGPRGTFDIMPRIRVGPQADGSFFYGVPDGETVRMKVLPEVQLKLDEAMSRLRGTLQRVRPRGWVDADAGASPDAWAAQAKVRDWSRRA